MLIAITIAVYFALLLVISRVCGGRGDNDSFFRGGRRSPWPLVAFGMIGASLSGVTFVSVPGMVMSGDMTYLQMCLGFFFGYLLVAYVLIPLYYRYGLTSVYGYLDTRFGPMSRKTGAWFFILSKLAGASVRLYLVCILLQRYVLDALGVPYAMTVCLTLVLIWLYTRRSGIKAIVWTDSLQTLFLILALLLVFIQAGGMLDMNFGEALKGVWADSHSRVFEWGDWGSKQHFVKQFLSGVFIVVVMTGLDQDMMQKTLTCHSQRDAQKNLVSYGAMFLPVNFLFLGLGILLMMLYTQMGTPVPTGGDSLLPGLVATGAMGETVVICFTIGVIAAAFSSADSASTALTTSFCVDILGIEDSGSRFSQSAEKVRKRVHMAVLVLFAVFILAFSTVGSSSVIDAIYVIAGYTYGPLLGLFAFGILTRRSVIDSAVPFVAVLSPVICLIVDSVVLKYAGYKFGYEMLMLNGLLTFGGLYAFSRQTVPTDALSTDGDLGVMNRID